ncbi:hypothetical protein HK101_011403 [Irineochytrium annulatum]|nr:hypothetical protein HK101_011403 [Irineochytrium annulatum]
MVLIGQWVTATAGTSERLEPLWWAIQIGFASVIQICGTSVYMTVMLVLAAVGGLSNFGLNLSLVNSFDVDWSQIGFNNTFFDVGLNATSSTQLATWQALFPTGAMGILNGLTSSQLMFIGETNALGIGLLHILSPGLESIPLMTEESHNFVTDGPGAVLGALGALTVLFWLVVVIQPNVGYVLPLKQ